MKTLNELINAPRDQQNSEEMHGVIAAIQAAFWAGQEEMRGKIVRGMIERYKSYPLGRYHKKERKAMGTIMSDGLLGGEGRDDSSEFLSWEFNI